MVRERTTRNAAVGVAEHGNSADLVTVSSDGELIDRRRIDLTEGGLPTHPYHHEGAWAVGRYKNSAWSREISLEEAIELIELVHEAAAHGARASLEALVADSDFPISTIAIRKCPKLPPTIEERIMDSRAQTVADSVMYREALATAATARGWSVYWYDREKVFNEAASVVGCEDINIFLLEMGKTVGPPWQAKHKLAAVAALAATARPKPSR